jgi:TIR domain
MMLLPPELFPHGRMSGLVGASSRAWKVRPVSRIFLSHSSRDWRAAVALKRWLGEQRPELANDIFLDIDADTGLPLGKHWDAHLLTSNSRCEYLICLVSENWAGSRECAVEYRTAEGFSKRILVVRLEDAGDGAITKRWRRYDLFADGEKTEIQVRGGPPARFSSAALDQLKKAIEGTGAGPETFAWPPKEDPRRAPYRGGEPFEDIDAAVFFGRDAEIAHGLDELGAMRFRLVAQLSGRKSLFVVRGPSGSGKSSFLRAGLIPRLQRDDCNFVVLGIVRPERNVLTGSYGLAAAIHSARQALNLPGSPPLGEIKRACREGEAESVCQLLMEVRAAAIKRLADTAESRVASPTGAGVGAASPQPSVDRRGEPSGPTLVLPLDQAEELFSGEAVSTAADQEAERFLELLAAVIGRINTDEARLLVAASIRTDGYAAMQNHPALDGIGTVLFNDLKTIPSQHFPAAIKGPAARSSEAGRRLSIADDLVDRLIADADEGAATLPLLALTLNRLYTDYGSAGHITLSDYDSMGGMPEVLNNQIEQILAAGSHDRDTALETLRSAFSRGRPVINPDNDQPMRRVALESELPAESRPLIDAFVDNRLLVRDQRDGQVVLAVAMESLLTAGFRASAGG